MKPAAATTAADDDNTMSPRYSNPAAISIGWREKERATVGEKDGFQ